MARTCSVVGFCTALMSLAPSAFAESDNAVASSARAGEAQPTSLRRFDSRAVSSPKYGISGVTERDTPRSGVGIGPNVPGGGTYDLLLDGGTVFALQNGTTVVRSTDMVYNGPRDVGPGTNTVTPAPGAALLAAFGFGMIGFIRRRAGVASTHAEE